MKEAASILSQKPYEAVTMDEVAKALGCGKSTLYKYFESKDLLFALVIYGQLEDFMQQLEKSCLQEPNTLQALSKCLETSYWFFQQNRQLFSSWLHYESNQEVRTEFFDKVHHLMEDKQKKVAALFQRGMDAGLVNASFDPSVLAYIVEKFFLSCVFSPLINDPEEDVQNLFTLKHILCSGILTPAALAQTEFAPAAV